MKRKLIGVIIVGVVIAVGISAFYYFKKPTDKSEIASQQTTVASGGSSISISTNSINNATQQNISNTANSSIQENNTNDNKGSAIKNTVRNNKSSINNKTEKENKSNINSNIINNPKFDENIAREVICKLLIEQHLIKSKTQDNANENLVYVVRKINNQQIAVSVSSNDGEPGSGQDLANFNVSSNSVYLNLGDVFTINSSCKQIANWNLQNGNIIFSNLVPINSQELLQNGYGFPS